MISDVVSTSSSTPIAAFIAVILLVVLICLLFVFSNFLNRYDRSKRVLDLEGGGIKSWKVQKGLLSPQRQNSLPFPAPPPYPGQDLTILPPPPAYLTSDSQAIQSHSPMRSSDPTREGPHSESGAILLFVVPSEVPLYTPSENAPSLYSPMRPRSLASGSEEIVIPSPVANSSPNLASR